MGQRTRRRYLAGVLAVAGLAGCTGTSDDDPEDSTEDGDDEPAGSTAETATTTTGGSDGPEAAVESFYAALNAGNVQSANELLHADSSVRAVSELRSDDLAAGTVELAGTEIIEEGEEFAVVRVTVLDSSGNLNTPEQIEADIEVQTEDGTWKLYDGFPADESDSDDGTEDDDGSDPDSSSSAAGDPATVVDRYYEALDEGDVETLNELMHNSEFGEWRITEQQIQPQINGEVTTEGTTTVSRNGDLAVVETTYRFDRANPDLGDTVREYRITLQIIDGSWRITEGGDF